MSRSRRALWDTIAPKLVKQGVLEALYLPALEGFVESAAVYFELQLREDDRLRRQPLKASPEIEREIAGWLDGTIAWAHEFDVVPRWEPLDKQTRMLWALFGVRRVAGLARSPRVH